MKQVAPNHWRTRYITVNDVGKNLYQKNIHNIIAVSTVFIALIKGAIMIVTDRPTQFYTAKYGKAQRYKTVSGLSRSGDLYVRKQQQNIPEYNTVFLCTKKTRRKKYYISQTS